MPTDEIIFVGSSSEGERHARLVVKALMDDTDLRRLKLHPWWRDSVFRPGDTFIETIEREADEATAAIFVFSPDDEATVRDTPQKVPRDNVVFEYGVFLNSVGRRRVAIVRIDDAKLPSDLLNVKTVDLRGHDDDGTFCDDARAKLEGWARTLSQGAQRPHPQLTQQLQALNPVLCRQPVRVQERFDRHAARAVQTAFLSVLTDSQGVNDAFAQLAEHELKEAMSISAADATGPAGWVGPSPYRYLALQVREYLYENRVDGKWRPFAHPWLCEALNRTLAKACQLMPDGQSATRFDDKGEARLEEGAPRLQYSRVLLWSDEELEDPVARAVIMLHEAFRIPLFYLPTEQSSRDKAVAYVAFEKRNGRVTVLYGKEENKYEVTGKDGFRETGVVPGLGRALDHYKGLLARDELMLAYDAWELKYGSRE
jgi:hypothetical protein